MSFGRSGVSGPATKPVAMAAGEERWRTEEGNKSQKGVLARLSLARAGGVGAQAINWPSINGVRERLVPSKQWGRRPGRMGKPEAGPIGLRPIDCASGWQKPVVAAKPEDVPNCPKCLQYQRLRGSGLAKRNERFEAGLSLVLQLCHDDSSASKRQSWWIWVCRLDYAQLDD
ncbi:unnamed protein product [Protopolystoma xenopodis]|uniref:Uncharacterized protein n=1 Tax=Protopolystoma xenopodis TaxID=117903 RepID=A0A3S5C999_9PLAT|nr:unnamed protein product [Protopolystoma xenopodis]